MNSRDKLSFALETLLKGGIVIVCDDSSRENEGDFVALGDRITPDVINFMITHGRGILCAAVGADVARRLELKVFEAHNASKWHTNFAQSIDHVSCTTGVSAVERADTIRAIADTSTTYGDFRSPGHMFPVIAHPGGVKARRGHTESVIELADLAGCPLVGAMCEIVGKNGDMANESELFAIATELGTPMLHVDDIANGINDYMGFK